MKRTGAIAFISSFVLTALFAFIPSAQADTIVRVAQVLPPNGQACPVLGATDVTPYIYDGELHSFDISITDSAYVAVSAQVGGVGVPFSQVSRWFNGQTGVKLHVDIQPTPLTADLPITVTLVAPHAGTQGVTCVATLGAIVPAVHPARTVPEPVGQDGGVPSQHSPAYVPPQYPWSHISYQNNASAKPVPTHPAATATAATSGASVVTATHALGNACTTVGGPARVWVILLVLYAIFTWLLASRMVMAGKESRDWNVALVVAGFLALLFFWYISAACRTGSWAPILATIIACAGLIALTQSSAGGEGGVLLLNKQKQPDLIAEKGKPAV